MYINKIFPYGICYNHRLVPTPFVMGDFIQQLMEAEADLQTNIRESFGNSAKVERNFRS